MGTLPDTALSELAWWTTLDILSSPSSSQQCRPLMDVKAETAALTSP